MNRLTRRSCVLLLLAMLAAACGPRDDGEPVLTVSGSALGAEGAVLTRQIERFMAQNPGLRVVIATLGGAQLAINAHSRHPQEWRAYSWKASRRSTRTVTMPRAT